MDAGDMRALIRVQKAFAAEAELAAIKARSKERVRDKNTGKFRSMKPGGGAHQAPEARRSGKALEAYKANPSDKKAAAMVFEDI